MVNYADAKKETSLSGDLVKTFQGTHAIIELGVDNYKLMMPNCGMTTPHFIRKREIMQRMRFFATDGRCLTSVQRLVFLKVQQIWFFFNLKRRLIFTITYLSHCGALSMAGFVVFLLAMDGKV